MPQDPFQGRALSEGPPYDNALTVTRADGDALPVIPSAFYIPGVLGEADENGARTFFTNGGQSPFSTYTLSVEMHNGAVVEIRTAGISVDHGRTILNPMRIRKILWQQSHGLQAVTLLW